MSQFEVTKKTPENIDELKRMANNQNNWRERLSAVKELRKYDCQQSRDILTRLAIHDIVFQVKEEAFRATQLLGITKNGKPLYLGKKPKGNLVKDIGKKLARVRNSLYEEYSLDEFKQKFQQLYPIAYDAYEGDKGKRFDEWLKSIISNIPKK